MDNKLEDIKKSVEEFFKNKGMSNITYPEVRTKILGGYLYSAGGHGDRKIKIMTGKGGALALIDAYEKEGIPAWAAQSGIFVNIKDKMYSLSDVSITPNEEFNKEL